MATIQEQMDDGWSIGGRWHRDSAPPGTVFKFVDVAIYVPNEAEFVEVQMKSMESDSDWVTVSYPSSLERALEIANYLADCQWTARRLLSAAPGEVDVFEFVNLAYPGATAPVIRETSQYCWELDHFGITSLSNLREPYADITEIIKRADEYMADEKTS